MIATRMDIISSCVCPRLCLCSSPISFASTALPPRRRRKEISFVPDLIDPSPTLSPEPVGLCATRPAADPRRQPRGNTAREENATSACQRPATARFIRARFPSRARASCQTIPRANRRARAAPRETEEGRERRQPSCPILLSPKRERSGSPGGALEDSPLSTHARADFLTRNARIVCTRTESIIAGIKR